TAYKFNPPSAVPAPHYVFLPEERAEPDAAAVPPKHQSNGDGPAKVQTRDLSALVMARDISGRMRYGAVSALLYLIATAAFVYGAAGLVRRNGILALFVAILFLIPLSVALSGCAPTFEAIRPLVVELIFRDAEARKILPLSPFGETASMIALWVRVNTGAALLAIGMLLA